MKENYNINIETEKERDANSYIVSITGASGAIYGFSLLKALINRSFFVHLIISKPGFRVSNNELGMFADISDFYMNGGGDSLNVYSQKIKNEKGRNI